jgi:pyrroline-5-carboxylate reductase
MSHTTAPLAARSAAPPHDRAPTRRFAIIGAGTMGRALATGMLRSACVTPPHLAVAGRNGDRAARLAADLGARHAASNRDACRDADVVLLCVKPKDMHPLLSDLAASGAFERRPLLISIAAGVSLESIEQIVGPEVSVVRAMPNTPSCIGHGMTVISAGRQATAEHLATAEEIFASVGRVLALDERHLDAVTAVSASGPAFIYLIVEALADGGVMCGLTRQTATELVAQMTLGAAAMVLASGKHPAQLKDDVTTPGGCTIAGLLVLEERHIRSALARAVQTTTRVAAGLGR